MKRSALFIAVVIVFGALEISAADRLEQNKQIVKRMIDAVNERDFDVLDEVISANIQRHSGATPGLIIENLEQFKAFLRQDLASVPDAQQEVSFMVAEADKVAVHATYRGTQDGPFGPFPPSGKKLELTFIGILRLEDGKIVEMWVEWDNLSALTQLGHFPPPDSRTE